MLFILILLFAFGAGTFLALSLTSLLGAGRESVARRLDALAPAAVLAAPLPSLAEAELEGGWRDRFWLPARQRLARLGTRLTPDGTRQRLKASLVRAGQPAGLGPGEFAGLRVLSILLCVALAAPACGLLWLNGARPLLLVLLLIGGALVGSSLPDALLEQAIRRRQAKVRRALPDAIDLLVVSVEAGMGLEGALAKVTEKMPGPLSEDLARAMTEMRLGKTRSQALKDMAVRLDVGELKTFVAAVTQADQLGTGIARVLRAQSRMARSSRVLRVREQAARLPVTLLFPLVVFIFPAIFVVLLGPSLIRLYQALSRMS